MADEAQTEDARRWWPSGGLVLVATPIGNLADVSDRARTALHAASVIACEDTRNTRRLLAALGADTSPRRLWAVHDHNEAVQAAAVCDLVAGGNLVVVVSDAGMPGIADPSARLVDAALTRGLPVSVVPGPSAAVAALVVSGQPTDTFTFVGFPPRKGSARASWLRSLAVSPATTVLFESPLRTAATLQDLAEALGGARSATVVRELTKVHEEIRRATLGELAAHYSAAEVRGEIVIVVAGAHVEEHLDEAAVEDALRAGLERGEKLKSVAVEVAARFGLNHRAVYDQAVELQRELRAANGASSAEG